MLFKKISKTIINLTFFKYFWYFCFIFIYNIPKRDFKLLNSCLRMWLKLDINCAIDSKLAGR